MVISLAGGGQKLGGASFLLSAGAGAVDRKAATIDCREIKNATNKIVRMLVTRVRQSQYALSCMPRESRASYADSLRLSQTSENRTLWCRHDPTPSDPTRRLSFVSSRRRCELANFAIL